MMVDGAQADLGPAPLVRPAPWRERAEPWFWLAPSLLVLLGIGLYPSVYTLIASFQYWVLTSGAPEWTWFDNYVQALTSSDFGGAVGRTLLLLAITLPAELVLGMLIALALDSAHAPILRRLLQVCLVIPIAVTPAVIGLLTQLLFNEQLGVVNYGLARLGAGPVDWLGDPTMAYVTVVIVQIWEWTPFVALVLSASLSTVPKDIEEAAMLETERWWPRFRGVVLPYMRPGITAALVFQTAFTIKEFDTIYTIGRGGPGTATETAILQVERLAFRGFDIGVSSAESVLLLILSIILARTYIRAFYREID